MPRTSSGFSLGPFGNLNRRSSSGAAGHVGSSGGGASTNGGDYQAMLQDDAQFLDWAQSPNGRAQIATELRRCAAAVVTDHLKCMNPKLLLSQNNIKHKFIMAYNT